MSANTVLDPEHMTPSQYVGQQSSEGGGKSNFTHAESFILLSA